MEILAAGYQLPEAPTVMADGSLVFTDVLGGGVMRLTASGAVETIVAKRRGVGGAARHTDGGVVVSGRDVIHVAVDGTQRTILKPPPGVQGFNDLTALADGRVVVGALRYRPFDEEEPVPGEFLAVGSGTTRPAITGIDWPNGVAVFESTLYCCDYLHGRVHAAEIRDDGFGPASVVAESPTGHADGLAVDAEGNLHVATGPAPGIARFKPSGEMLDPIEVPAAFTSSLCFAGDDGRDLIVTVSGNTVDPARGGAVLRSRNDIPGAPVFAATV